MLENLTDEDNACYILHLVEVQANGQILRSSQHLVQPHQPAYRPPDSFSTRQATS